MEIGLVLTLCGLGIAFWIPAFILGMISGNKMRKCTADATATVVRINVRNSGDNGLSYHPVYEYYAGGSYYTSDVCRQLVQKSRLSIIRTNQSSPTYRDMIIRCIRY